MSNKQKEFNCPNGITSDGSVPVAGVTAACGPSMLGKTVHIEGYGTRICQDRGSMITDNHIDIYVDTLQEAYNIGRRRVSYKIK